MGNPLFADDVAQMCFNGAKSWQLNWYDDRELELNPLANGGGSQEVTMVGIADYQRTANYNPLPPVITKLRTGTSKDFYLVFNRATGANAQNDEADNLVTLVEANNPMPQTVSSLKWYGGQGSSYVIGNFGNSGDDLIIEVVEINDNDNDPWTAKVRFTLDTCTQNSDCDDGNACNGAETCSAGKCSPGIPLANCWYVSLVLIVYLILCISILAHPTHYFLFLVVMTSVRQARILHHVLPTVAPSSLRLRLKITMALVAMSSRYEQRKISL